MAWSIEISPLARRGLKTLDPPLAKRIIKFLFERVALLEDPREMGEALHGPELGKYWKYRVGDYRLITHIQDAHLLIVVVRVGHRSEVYR